MLFINSTNGDSASIDSNFGEFVRGIIVRWIILDLESDISEEAYDLENGYHDYAYLVLCFSEAINYERPTKCKLPEDEEEKDHTVDEIATAMKQEKKRLDDLEQDIFNRLKNIRLLEQAEKIDFDTIKF